MNFPVKWKWLRTIHKLDYVLFWSISLILVAESGVDRGCAGNGHQRVPIARFLRFRSQRNPVRFFCLHKHNGVRSLHTLSCYALWSPSFHLVELTNQKDWTLVELISSIWPIYRYKGKKEKERRVIYWPILSR